MPLPRKFPMQSGIVNPQYISIPRNFQAVGVSVEDFGDTVVFNVEHTSTICGSSSTVHRTLK